MLGHVLAACVVVHVMAGVDDAGLVGRGESGRLDGEGKGHRAAAGDENDGRDEDDF